MIMSSPHRVTGEAFALERLRTNPDLDYATLRAEANESGVSLQPIHYGRARKQLGLPALRDSRPEQKPRIETLPTPSEAVIVETHVDTPPPAPVAKSARKSSVPFEFLIQELRREPGLTYGELRDRATARGFPIAPIMYGRAKAVLGLVPVKPRGKKNAAAAPPAPRTLKQIESITTTRGTKGEGTGGLEQLVEVVKSLDADRRRLRAVLERVVAMIDEALDRN
jgi:hypothetical protein